MRIMKLKGAESTDHCNPTNDMNQKNSDKNLCGNYQTILNIFSTIFYLGIFQIARYQRRQKKKTFILKIFERNFKLKRGKFLHNFDT